MSCRNCLRARIRLSLSEDTGPTHAIIIKQGYYTRMYSIMFQKIKLTNRNTIKVCLLISRGEICQHTDGLFDRLCLAWRFVKRCLNMCFCWFLFKNINSLLLISSASNNNALTKNNNNNDDNNAFKKKREFEITANLISILRVLST